MIAIFWRARDGKGTHTHRICVDMTEAEVIAETHECQRQHPEATMIWAVDRNRIIGEILGAAG